MSSISAQDLQRLAGLQGYDLTLELDAMSRKYGMSPDEIAVSYTHLTLPTICSV